MNQFDTRTLNYWLSLLADFLPESTLAGVMAAKRLEGKNLNLFLSSAAKSCKYIDDSINQWVNEISPEFTTIFLREWEQVVGIPDQCIPIANTVEERRQNIILKLRSLSVRTAEDFEALGSALGLTITVKPFLEQCQLGGKLPIILNSVRQGGAESWTIWISGTVTDQLKCLFEKVKPDQTIIIYDPCS